MRFSLAGTEDMSTRHFNNLLPRSTMDQTEIAQLSHFHTVHFPGQPIPKLSSSQPQVAEEVDSKRHDHADGDDGLGYYEDGVKRTLTDEQIEMFRHSEIQRLLGERRAAREKEARQKKRPQAGNNTKRTVEGRKRRFDDEPQPDHPVVDGLVYDDQLDREPVSSPQEKKFIWPVLGEAST